jgi:ABC-2 type transport system ATP-binding protein
VDSPRRALDILGPVVGLDRLQLFGDRLHVRVDDPARAGDLRRALDQAGVGPGAIRPIVPSLEDVFIDYVSSGGRSEAPPRDGL